MKVKAHNKEYILTEEDQDVLYEATVGAIIDVGSFQGLKDITKSGLVGKVIEKVDGKIDEDKLFTFLFAEYVMGMLNVAMKKFKEQIDVPKKSDKTGFT